VKRGMLVLGLVGLLTPGLLRASESSPAAPVSEAARSLPPVWDDSDTTPGDIVLLVAPPPTSAATCTPRSSCCRVCGKGKACGNSCISRKLVCHKGHGCACDSADVCL
jgi:hypothetical protein